MFVDTSLQVLHSRVIGQLMQVSLDFNQFVQDVLWLLEGYLRDTAMMQGYTRIAGLSTMQQHVLRIACAFVPRRPVLAAGIRIDTGQGYGGQIEAMKGGKLLVGRQTFHLDIGIHLLVGLDYYCQGQEDYYYKKNMESEYPFHHGYAGTTVLVL
jgi:hypothetical protein